MNADELAARIDHTVLGPGTTIDDVEDVLDACEEYGMNACIPPCYVAEAAEYAPDVTLATVVGFPHGQHTPGVKAAEAEAAWNDGADELDVVINVGRLTHGESMAVRNDLERVVAATPLDVKVIVEAGLLTDEEKHDACELAREAGAEMVKTSTGFSAGGAAVADVELMSDYLPVKASGGIGDYETAKAMLDAGAERIGASSGVEIVEDYRENYA
ncbi:deoxyribose-phosphate aldolase [Halospeciosus flavus]|uniref:Deoxyribose-phosphate aldolase n=1 Tax=Halospeciosus flavus TaxID=3032283 RepID=A0ABD5Z8L6_9EURY|nr:deoxyribose-phosphate aldolase [Halospeciosus flavus]